MIGGGEAVCLEKKYESLKTSLLNWATYISLQDGCVVHLWGSETGQEDWKEKFRKKCSPVMYKYAAQKNNAEQPHSSLI